MVWVLSVIGGMVWVLSVIGEWSCYPSLFYYVLPGVLQPTAVCMPRCIQYFSLVVRFHHHNIYMYSKNSIRV